MSRLFSNSRSNCRGDPHTAQRRFSETQVLPRNTWQNRREPAWPPNLPRSCWGKSWPGLRRRAQESDTTLDQSLRGCGSQDPIANEQGKGDSSGRRLLSLRSGDDAWRSSHNQGPKKETAAAWGAARTESGATSDREVRLSRFAFKQGSSVPSQGRPPLPSNSTSLSLPPLSPDREPSWKARGRCTPRG